MNEWQALPGGRTQWCRQPKSVSILSRVLTTDQWWTEITGRIGLNLNISLALCHWLLSYRCLLKSKPGSNLLYGEFHTGSTFLVWTICWDVQIVQLEILNLWTWSVTVTSSGAYNILSPLSLNCSVSEIAARKWHCRCHVWAFTFVAPSKQSFAWFCGSCRWP
jgi:hypothetical protein